MPAYIAKPKWYDIKKTRKRASFSDAEVARGFMACIEIFFVTKRKGICLRQGCYTLIQRQFVTFVRGQRDFRSNEAKRDLSMVDPTDWWTFHGTNYKEL
eukprot:Gb_18910 [translate_table: standard]